MAKSLERDDNHSYESENNKLQVEIERTFILQPDAFSYVLELIHGAPFHDITQIYQRNEKKLRLRSYREMDLSTSYTSTFKKKMDGFGQKIEVELPISQKEFYNGFKQPHYGPLAKRRFNTDEFEVDLFMPPFLGYVRLEKEFDSPEDLERYIPPQWVIEVTDNRGFTNRKMAKYQRVPPDIAITVFNTLPYLKNFLYDVPFVGNPT